MLTVTNESAVMLDNQRTPGEKAPQHVTVRRSASVLPLRLAALPASESRPQRGGTPFGRGKSRLGLPFRIGPQALPHFRSDCWRVGES